MSLFWLECHLVCANLLLALDEFDAFLAKQHDSGVTLLANTQYKYFNLVFRLKLIWQFFFHQKTKKF